MTETTERAVEVYEKGDPYRAASMLHHIRMEAKSDGDEAKVADVYRIVEKMRSYLEGDPLDAFNTHYRYGIAPDNAKAAGEEVDVSPVGLAIALAGVAGLVIAAFLPYAESTTFARVAQNTLIQEGDGWVLIGLALTGAFAIYRAYKSKRRNPGPIITGVIAIAGAIYFGTSKSNLTLCPVGSTSLSSACQKASPGVGVYVAGVAGLLMVVGGWQMMRSNTIASSSGDTKTCPECAETVKAAARVCKHCGYRFQPGQTA